MANECSYRVFGDLLVPDPVGLLSAKRLAQLERLRPILDSFETLRRQPANFDLTAAFEKFQKSEILLWPQGKDARLMVRPSGSLESPLNIHLHYPTETTRNSIYNGEIADIKSPCPQMIMTAGFTSQNSFWWDSHPWREPSRFEPSRKYSKAILNSHRAWEAILRRESHAKIEIVFGKPVQQAIEEEFGHLIEKFVLWDGYETTIHLQFTTPSKAILDRIYVYVNHPMFFYYNITLDEGKLMDARLKIASDLAGIERSPRQESYFAWRSLDRQGKKDSRAAGGIEFPKRKRDDDSAEPTSQKRRVHRGTARTAQTDARLLFPNNMTVKTQCESCGYLGMDDCPAFWKTDPRFYVIRTKKTCKGCSDSDQRVYQVPTGDIPWMRADISFLKKEANEIIKIYNEWAATTALSDELTTVLTVEEQEERDGEEKQEARQAILDTLDEAYEWDYDEEYLYVHEYLYIDEIWYRDNELGRAACDERNWLKQRKRMEPMGFLGS